MINEEFLREISLEGEEWKDVVGYEGRYFISNCGRLVSFTAYNNHPSSPCRQCLVKYRKNSHGYYMASFYKDGKRRMRSIHRVVAEAFIPNPENKPCIDHIDRNPLNNHISNLRWVTQSENLCNPLTKEVRIGSKHNIIPPNRKSVVQLKDGEVIKIYDYITQAKKDGFSQSVISRCCLGELKQYKGYQWMYLSDYEASCQ